jgi:Fe-S-cluster containining protein
MNPSLTDRLCTQCGLCCDGSLFADVELAGRAEALRAEVMGLRIDDDADAMLMLLPCSALKGTRCSIYPHRPQCCRTFECRLLKDVRRGAVGVKHAEQHIAEAFRRIGRVKDLLAQIGERDARLPLKERCAEALALGADSSPAVKRNRAALEHAMSEVEALLREHFLWTEAI